MVPFGSVEYRQLAAKMLKALPMLQPLVKTRVVSKTLPPPGCVAASSAAMAFAM
jgi:hypothetical protein